MLSVYGRTLSPPSPHFVSHSVYLSHFSIFISCSIAFYTSSSLPLLCFQLSLFLYYRKSLLSHVWRAERKCPEKTWYQLNRSALSRERSESFLALAGWGHVCSGWTKGRDILKKSLSLSFSLCNADLLYVSRLIQHLCFVKHITVMQESGA